MTINLKRMIPFLDKDELTLLIEKIKTSENQEYEGVKLMSVIPFLEDEMIDKLFLEELDKDGSFVSIAPFVSDNMWPIVAEKIINGNSTTNIVGLFPFMDEKTLGDLFIKAEAEQIAGLDAVKFLPFVSDEAVDNAFLNRIKANKDYLPFLPFVTDECLHQFAEAFCQGDTEVDIDAMYPFMTQEDIKMIFRHVIEKKEN